MNYKQLKSSDVILPEDRFSSQALSSDISFLLGKTCESFAGLDVRLVKRAFPSKRVVFVYRAKKGFPILESYLPKGFKVLKQGQFYKHGDFLVSKNSFIASPDKHKALSAWQPVTCKAKITEHISQNNILIRKVK